MHNRALILLMGIIIFMVLSPSSVYGQTLDPVSFSITEAPQELKGGEVAEVVVQASIQGEWHLYSIANNPEAGPYPTRFSSANPDMAIAAEVKESEPAVALDPNFDTELGWHSNQATFTIPVEFTQKIQGTTMIDLKVLYQACDDKTCLPPKTKSITRPITIR